MDSAHCDVDAARRFNRFYTRQIGLLNDRLLQTPYTLTEGRLMFEIARQPEVTASDLSRDLGLDPGYLSRTLRRGLNWRVIAYPFAPFSRRRFQRSRLR